LSGRTLRESFDAEPRIGFGHHSIER
jgi:hypothetical protein